MLALRVSPLCNVVRNAAITAITKAVAKIPNTVRWVFIFKVPTPWGDSEIAFIELARAATRADIRAGGRIPVC
jgi:hypothetical protein